MSRPRENDKPENNPGLGEQNKPADQNVPPVNNDSGLGEQDKPADQNVPPGNNDQKKEKPEILTIEEHRKNLNISAPVFAAVIQAKGWASGKRVPVEIFEKAVKNFLGAPMDGMENRLSIEEHQKKLEIDAPVIEAVMKAKGWRINSKLTEAVFKEAVEEYLNAHKEGGE